MSSGVAAAANWLTLERASGACALAVMIVCALIQRRKPAPDNKITLVFLLSRLTAGSTIPTGLVLVAAAFDSSKLAVIKDVWLSLLAAGIAVLYLAYSAVSEADS